MFSFELQETEGLYDEYKPSVSSFDNKRHIKKAFTTPPIKAIQIRTPAKLVGKIGSVVHVLDH